MSAVNQQEKSVNGIIIDQGVTTIGRGRNNTMSLPFDTISIIHAKIIAFNKTAFIQDLGSTNGTYVNGKRVDQQVLRKGDHVIVGNYEFTIDGFE
jgi:pSer/pThr/pTyr-binding forkhead associated (FHA) protein